MLAERKIKKLILMFTIIYNETPNYLKDLLRSLVNDVINYNLRNNTNYDLPFVCVLRPSQPNGVMSSAVSLPNHTFTGQT